MFEEIIDYLTPSAAVPVSSALKLNGGIMEVRLRKNKPLVIIGSEKSFLIDSSGREVTGTGEPVVCDAEDFDKIFNRLCDYSVYSHADTIMESYITIRGGHRIGVACTAVVKDGKVIGTKDISSLNFRFAREIKGAADDIMKHLINQRLIIFGPPCSGKTTVLRDLARQLSNRMHKICIIDERGEIAALHNGVPNMDVGINTDILNAFPKENGIVNAVRTLSPEYIVFDEIGKENEGRAVLKSFSMGAGIITTAHASDIRELLFKSYIKNIMDSGLAGSAVQLSGEQPGKIKRIYSTDEIRKIYSGGGSDCACLTNREKTFGFVYAEAGNT